MFPVRFKHMTNIGKAGIVSTKNNPAYVLQCGRPGFDPWDGKIPWRRKSRLAPLFSSGESHGQRNLAVYSPWGRKELDITK